MDLSTTYLGMKLKNPIVPSAGPLSHTVESIKRLEDAGAAAVVMYSLFEEQISHDAAELNHYLSYGTESFAESLTYFPEADDYYLGPEEYLNLLQRAKAAVHIPVIGSLNGTSTGGWIEYAKKIEEAGANALELNVYSRARRYCAGAPVDVAQVIGSGAPPSHTDGIWGSTVKRA